MSLKSADRGRILLVDDDRHLLESMSQWLTEQGYQLSVASNIEDTIASLKQQPFDLVLVDIRLGTEDGFDILEYCRKYHSETSVILITGYGSVETAIEALRRGAFDLLTKPLIDEELRLAIERSLSQREVIEENRQLKAQLDLRFGLDNIVGRDRRMQRIFEMIEHVADTRATVLITGESGTGKSMIARAIHRHSQRRDQAFVEVACGALPETLLESELFGHVAGAFTGAIGNKIGKFEQADLGTIFLDEIATASQGMQVKLLRVLQDLEFEPVGGTETRHIDTRVILATNEILANAVADGRFRQDLFYRINVINIELPPLRSRLTDIPALSDHFLHAVCEEANKQVEGFSDEAMAAMRSYSWPGNVRELQNIVERAVLLGQGPTIGVDDLPLELTANVPIPVVRTAGRTLKEALEGPERQIIMEVLESNSWNRNLTAETLGINRTTLYKKMKRLGIDDKEADPSCFPTAATPTTVTPQPQA